MKSKGIIMRTQLPKLLLTAIGLTAVAVTGFVPGYAFADDRPQEVLDLIADHEVLAMKIRPLRYRVVAAASKDRDDRFGSESPQVRAVSDDDDRITDRLAALDKSASTERERVNAPRFGVDLAKRDKDIIDARKQLAALEREVAVLEREVDALER